VRVINAFVAFVTDACWKKERSVQSLSIADNKFCD